MALATRSGSIASLGLIQPYTPRGLVSAYFESMQMSFTCSKLSKLSS